MLPYNTQICKEHKENPVLIATDCEDQTRISQEFQIRASLICLLFSGTVTSFATFKAAPPSMDFCLCLVTFQIHFMEHPIPLTRTQSSFCFHSPLRFLKVYKLHMYASYTSHLPMSSYRSKKGLQCIQSYSN